MRKKVKVLFVMMLLLALVLPYQQYVKASNGGLNEQNHPPLAPVDLNVNDLKNPLNVEGTPHFGWILRDQDRNEVQSAYQIKVFQWGADQSKLIWNSGKVQSSQQSYVPYGGDPLKRGTTYTWTVRTWDREGNVSPWADRVSFDTGIRDQDWHAK